MYYHFYLSPFIFSCKESFNSSSFLKFEILISWASSPLGYAYYILRELLSTALFDMGLACLFRADGLTRSIVYVARYTVTKKNRTNTLQQI